MPLRLTCKFDRILISILLVLPFQIIFTKITKISGNHLNGTTYGVLPSLMRTNDQFVNESRKSYPNHRMDTNDSLPQQPVTNSGQDRVAADSILRPQLALQIFTNQAPNLDQDESKTHKFNQQTSKGSGSIFILPLSQQQDGPTEKVENQPTSNSMSELKLNPWHYVTDQSAASNPTIDNYGVESSESSDSDGGLASHSSAPTINAIITVPAIPSEHHYHHHHQGDQQVEVKNLNLSSTVIAEQALSRLLDNQTSGNIEFSMNLNGEEIIINPVNKRIRAANSTDATPFLGEQQFADADDQSHPTIIERFPRRSSVDSHPSRKSKALKKHVELDQAGDQESASETDFVDGNSESTESTDEYDQSNKESKRPHADHEIQGIEDGFEKGERKYWATEISQKEPNGNEQSTDESNHQDRTIASVTTDRGSSRQSDQDRRTARHSKQKDSRQQSVNVGRKKNLSNPAPRHASSSRRKPIFRSEDREPNKPIDSEGEERRPSDAASIVIRGEDVKKFEQLLENLRALSLNRISLSKPKNIIKNSRSHRNELASHDDEDSSQDEKPTNKGMPSKQWNNNYKAVGQQRSHSSATNRLTQTEPVSGSDCDRSNRYNRPITDETSPSEPESSPNVADPDLMSSNDSSDDIGEDGNQNVEQEEQGSDNHDKIVLPSSSEKSNSDSSQTDQEKDEPRSLFVRKTILQSYYDNNARHDNKQTGDSDLESIHKAKHEAQHEQFTHADGHRLPLVKSAHHSNPDASSGPGRPEPDDLSPMNNYIDYNQLNDREVYRGSESQKIKVTVPRGYQPGSLKARQILGKMAVDGERIGPLRV